MTPGERRLLGPQLFFELLVRGFFSLRPVDGYDPTADLGRGLIQHAADLVGRIASVDEFGEEGKQRFFGTFLKLSCFVCVMVRRLVPDQHLLCSSVHSRISLRKE